MIWPNKWFAPKPKLTDADFLEVGDSSGAGGVGVVGDSGACDGGAALSAAPLVPQDHREAARARIAALRQALIGDPDVVPGGQLGHCPPVVRRVHNLHNILR